MVFILKRRDFARWQESVKITDAVLCSAVEEMARGLIDGNLGGYLYEKRLAREGAGKRGGYRTLLAARIGYRYVSLHGYAKNEKVDITPDEKLALQLAGKIILELPHRGCP